MEDKTKDELNSCMISQLIYEIKTSSILIKESTQDKIIQNQIFMIDTILNSLSDVLYINNESSKLIKSNQNIFPILDNIISQFKPLFLTKRLKFYVQNEEDNFNICIDRNKIINSISSIFLHIYKYSKLGSSINIKYDIIDYQEDLNIFFNKKSLDDKFIEISISFDGITIPNTIKESMLKKSIISYRKTYTNNIYLYTAVSIIKKHKGKFWYKHKDNNHNIIILLPLSN